MPMGLPADAADATTARSVMLEVHYDNPNTVQIRDSSGFKLYYTDKLRDNDAMIMTLGHININIPPGAESHTHTNDCSAACTSKLKRPLTALWAGLHMHSAGKAIWTDHFRGSEQLPPLGHKRSWDFNQQSPTHLKAVIQPGDRLVTHCVYSSQTKDKRTRFGEGTDDEMCFNFLLVYPADGIRMCMDIGKVSNQPGATSLGVCLDTQGSSQGGLAALLGTDFNIGAISQETIPFGAEPIPSGNYRNPSCQQYVPPDAQGAAARLGLCRSAMLLPAALLALMLSRFF